MTNRPDKSDVKEWSQSVAEQVVEALCSAGILAQERGLYAPFGSDLPHRAIGVGERINTNVREPEVFNRTPEPLDVRLNRLATFEATGMSERWRKWKFPKDVIGDERLPFSRAEKRFDVALQKR